VYIRYGRPSRRLPCYGVLDEKVKPKIPEPAEAGQKGKDPRRLESGNEARGMTVIDAYREHRRMALECRFTLNRVCADVVNLDVLQVVMNWPPKALWHPLPPCQHPTGNR
jgi:hypothetical protein